MSTARAVSLPRLREQPDPETRRAEHARFVRDLVAVRKLLEVAA